MSRVKQIRNFYDPWMDGTGSNASRLAWNNTYNQYIRFDILRKNIRLNDLSLLDVGCGFGDLLDYLNKNQIRIEYTGVDILKRTVLIARRLHPTATFYNIDIFKEDDQIKNHDIVFASGTFNLDVGNNDEFIKRVIEVFHSKSNKYFCFNLLHERSEDKEKYYYYTSPKNILALLNDYPCEVKIVDDYLNNDFTVICKKRD